MTPTATTAVPTELRSPRSKLVYLYLRTNGAATVNELQHSLRMSKLTLYSVLRTMREEGIVRAEGERYALG